MLQFSNRRRFKKRALFAVALFGLMLFGNGQGAFAYPNPCQDESFPNDIGFDVGPGVLYVGIDQGPITGSGTYVCVSGNIFADSVGVGVYDPNPSSPGVTVRQWYCFFTECFEDISPTGAEAGTISPGTDGPGGGTAGASTAGNGTCVYVDGSTVPAGCSSLTIGSVTIAEGDVAKTQSGTNCVLDFPGGGPCEVSSFQVVVGDDAARQTITITVLNTSNSQNIPRDCLAGVGQACTF